MVDGGSPSTSFAPFWGEEMPGNESLAYARGAGLKGPLLAQISQWKGP